MSPGAVGKIKSQHIARASEKVGKSRGIGKPEIRRRTTKNTNLALCGTGFAEDRNQTIDIIQQTADITNKLGERT
jgi:hypothetical protein